MGRQEWPDVKSEQDDNLDEQARLLFTTELAASIVFMGERRNNSLGGVERVRRLSFS